VIAPVYLTSNQPAERFYRGGNKIHAFRAAAAEGDRVPEDWVASTTTVFGEALTGLSELPGGGLESGAAQDLTQRDTAAAPPAAVGV
jgi:mannose-6-phosphate isomerase